MAAGGWGCPHELNGVCSKILNLACDPGMKGCTLSGRYVFFDDRKNARLIEKRSRERLPANTLNAQDRQDTQDPSDTP